MSDLTRLPNPELDEGDCYALIRILRQWIDVRTAAGYNWPTEDHKPPNIPWPELSKSRLLLWLLQGHEPLPLPPPLYMSGPQHLVELNGYTGGAMEDPVVSDGTGWQEKGKLYWLFSSPWTIVNADLVPESGPVPVVEAYIVTMPEHLSGTWRIARTDKGGKTVRRGFLEDTPGWEGRRIEPPSSKPDPGMEPG